MVFENRSSLIIMLCPCKEDDKVMSAEYFPSDNKPNDRMYGNYKVHLVKETEEMQDLFVRDLEVTDESTKETI